MRIYLVLFCFQNTHSKLLNYRDVKSFPPQAFEEDLRAALIECGDSHDKFENFLLQRLINIDLKKENR